MEWYNHALNLLAFYNLKCTYYLTLTNEPAGKTQNNLFKKEQEQVRIEES